MVHKFIDPVFCRRMKAIITKGFFQCCLIFNNYLKTRYPPQPHSQHKFIHLKKMLKTIIAVDLYSWPVFLMEGMCVHLQL